MNVEYSYILTSFLPEIALVVLGLLVLAIDLVLPARSTRRTLTIVAAFGCLVVMVLSAQQWLASTPIAPDLVQRETRAMVQIWQQQIEPLGQSVQADPTDPSLPRVMQLPAEMALTNAEARAVVRAYQQQRHLTPQLPPREMGLAHPGFAAWWLFANDQFAAAFKVLFALAAFLVLLLSVRFPVERYRAEFAGLLIFATVGLMVMVNSMDLVVLFLGLELAAVCLYALASWHKGDARSQESGVKYLLLGSLASAFFIYGASLLFMQYGSTHLTMLGGAAMRLAPFALIGLLMLLIGFGFKVAAAPLHLWAPDVYQGAPTSMVAFLSTASKAAGFAVLLRVLSLGFPALTDRWVLLIGVMAALSMVVGNLVALHQNNVKRLLAYSGIAQAGYLLIAVMAVGLAGLHHSSHLEAAVTAAVLYLFLYTIANIGAFAIAGIVQQESAGVEMRDFAGLRTRAPLLAFGMTLLLLSLGGIPPLAGFVGKWFLFLSGVVEGQYILVLLGAALSVVSIYYYLLVVKQIYVLPGENTAPIRVGAVAGIGLTLIVFLTFLIGVFPRPFLDLATQTAQSLLHF
jgi:NADH-quinone oxidoreductase subunit N